MNHKIMLSEEYIRQVYLIQTRIWRDYAVWMRAYSVCVSESLKDVGGVTHRLQTVPNDLSNFYRVFYGSEITDEIRQLFSRSVLNACDYLGAIASYNNPNIEYFKSKWLNDFEKLSEMFYKFNINVDDNKIKNELFKIIELLGTHTSSRIRKNYTSDIIISDKIEVCCFNIAEHLSETLIKQFK